MGKAFKRLEGFDTLKCRFDFHDGPGIRHQTGLAGDTEFFSKTGANMANRFERECHAGVPI
jgi:hypothetical protein